ncbi:MAG TPA: FtsX-like permease family protein [Gammaproteobacteria bacterium]|nr:FtsX-like permease family protein [Gammaproteobacteria bacterium]
MIAHYCTTAVRNFARRPLSTAIKLFALALGFACFLTASFIADYVARVDRQWANDGRIYSLLQAVTAPGSEKESGPTIGAISPPAVKYLKVDFPDITIAATQTLSLPVSAEGKQQTCNILAVDPEFVRIFDLDVVGGRADALNEPTAVLLEASAARELFGATDPVGRSVHIATGDLTVAGVVRLPSPSHLGAGGIGKNARAFISRQAMSTIIPGFDPDNFPPIWAGTCCTTYLLRPENGPSLAEIQARLDKFSAARVPPEFGKIRFAPLSLGDMGKAYLNLGLFGGSLDLSLVTILRVFAALILAVACLDFANLATAEATARSREIGVRKTVGASRGQVVAQTMLEAGVLTAAALAIVLPLTLLVVTPLAAAIRLEITPADALGLPRYWLGVLAVAVTVCAAAGAYPALVLARVRPIFSLRSTTQRAGAAWVRTALTVAQFAAASFLLAAVAVMLLQRAELRGRLSDPTQDPRLTLTLNNVGPGFDPKAFRTEVLAHPSVKGLSGALSQPFRRAVVTGLPSSTVSRSEDPNATRVPVQTRVVFYDYFNVAGIRLLAGRDFDEAQDRPAPTPPADDAAPTPAQQLTLPTQHVIVDEHLAVRLGFTPQQAIGQIIYQPQQMNVAFRSGEQPRLAMVTVSAEIVGVAAATPLEYMAEGPDSYLYLVTPGGAGNLILRVARADVAGALAHIDATWTKFFPGRPPARQFLDEVFDANFQMFDMLGMTFVGLSVIAVVIAALGLFGIASFAVQRRAREIGVRKTMGASKRSVLGLMLWDFSKLVILGNVIAWPFAWLAARTYLDLFVQRIDLSPAPFAFALAVSLAIAWLAVLTHALRAAQVQPALVLKTE